MSKYKKILGVGAVVMIIVLAVGATLAFAQGSDGPIIGPTDEVPVAVEAAGPWAQLAHRFHRWQNWARWRELMDTALADELDVTVDKLQTAREAARLNALEQAVDEGLVREERVQLIIARLTLASTLEKGELTAQALGITVGELEVAREEGKTVRQLIRELALDPATVRDNLKAAYEEAIQQAVIEGALTQEQADLLLEYPPRLVGRVRANPGLFNLPGYPDALAPGFAG